MGWVYQLYINQFLVFTLVLTRVSGLLLIAPIFGSNETPMRIRAFLAVAIAVLVTPLQWGRVWQYPGNLLNYLVYLGAELLVGITLGLGIMLLLAGLQIAGQVISQVGGMQLADVYNPGFDASVPVFSHLFYLVALAVFVTIGGHRLLMEALLDTFEVLPPGSGGISNSVVETLTTLTAESFSLGIRAAAPAMTALLLATLILGLAGRTLPQLNVMALGFSFNSLIALGTLSISLGAAAYALQDHVEPTLEMLVESLSPQ